MGLLQDSDVAEVRERFAELTHPVKLVHFTQALDLEYGPQAKQLLEELTQVSDKLTLETYNFETDKEKVAEYAIDKVPATVIRNDKDYGIRFYGLPAGYEFSTLIDAILTVSQGDSGLRPETREKLARLTQPLHLQVFTTPTCPYCPPAVRMAYQFAMESDLVRADGIEATEFPDLATRFHVMAVPRTVINSKDHVEGSLREDFFLDAVLKTLEPQLASSCLSGCFS
jgi:glutaredoxin-like protein